MQIYIDVIIFIQYLDVVSNSIALVLFSRRAHK